MPVQKSLETYLMDLVLVIEKLRITTTSDISFIVKMSSVQPDVMFEWVFCSIFCEFCVPTVKGLKD